MGRPAGSKSKPATPKMPKQAPDGFTPPKLNGGRARKDAKPSVLPKPEEVAAAISSLDPAVAAAIMDAAITRGDEKAIDTICEQIPGLNRLAVRTFFIRMKTAYGAASQELRKVTTHQFLATIDDRIEKALRYMDEASFGNASLRDIAVTFGILVEKRALLRGEPTQRISITDRQGLGELGKLLQQELSRRDMALTPVMGAAGLEYHYTGRPEKTDSIDRVDRTPHRLHVRNYEAQEVDGADMTVGEQAREQARRDERKG